MTKAEEEGAGKSKQHFPLHVNIHLIPLDNEDSDYGEERKDPRGSVYGGGEGGLRDTQK